MRDVFVCEHCGATVSIDELNCFDGRELCDECFEDETVVCSRCGERIWADTAADSDIVLCQDCYDDYYTTCEHCGRTIPLDDAYYPDDEEDTPYCYNCYERLQQNEYIHDYNFKPSPIFYGDSDRYFGVELEIDAGGHSDTNAGKIAGIANQSEKLVYIKHDGSLDEGMEIVTHPMTLDFHMNKMPWQDVMEKAVSLGYKSHKTKTCGLHVHVNRTAFGDDDTDQEFCISRILFFVERFWQELLKFSRRTEYQINRWAARYGIKDNPKATLDNAKKHNLGRYTCVNLTNYSTIEFRIFRGTLKYNTLIATLQLVNRICDLATRLTDEEMTSLNWCDFVAGITEPELIEYLKSRRLYVNEPVECEEDV